MHSANISARSVTWRLSLTTKVFHAILPMHLQYKYKRVRMKHMHNHRQRLLGATEACVHASRAYQEPTTAYQALNEL